MSKNNWKKGRGKLGMLTPLIGTWKAEGDSPMGPFKCTRAFTKILNDSYIQLVASWEFASKTYIENAIYGVKDNEVNFWSFTSDGKNSEGKIADGTDVHPEAVCFEA